MWGARWRAKSTTVTITLPIMERGDDSTQIAEATAEKAAPPSDAAVHLNKLDLEAISRTTDPRKAPGVLWPIKEESQIAKNQNACASKQTSIGGQARSKGGQP